MGCARVFCKWPRPETAEGPLHDPPPPQRHASHVYNAHHRGSVHCASVRRATPLCPHHRPPPVVHNSEARRNGSGRRHLCSPGRPSAPSPPHGHGPPAHHNTVHVAHPRHPASLTTTPGVSKPNGTTSVGRANTKGPPLAGLPHPSPNRCRSMGTTCPYRRQCPCKCKCKCKCKCNCTSAAQSRRQRRLRCREGHLACYPSTALHSPRHPSTALVQPLCSPSRPGQRVAWLYPPAGPAFLSLLEARARG